MFYYCCRVSSRYKRTKEIRYFSAENIKDITNYLEDTFKENYLSKWEFIAFEDYCENEADYPDSDEALEEFCNSFTYDDYVESYRYSLIPIDEQEALNHIVKNIEKGM